MNRFKILDLLSEAQLAFYIWSFIILIYLFIVFSVFETDSH